MAMPPCVYLVSGSLPRLPTRMALLMPRAMDDLFGVRLLACRPPSAPRPPAAGASARRLPANDTGSAGKPCLDKAHAYRQHVVWGKSEYTRGDLEGHPNPQKKK